MRILFCRSNPIDPDPRVEKEAQALRDAGHQVQAVAWDRSGQLPTAENKNGLQVQRLAIRAAFGHGMGNLPALLKWQIGLLFWLIRQHKTYDILHACDFDTIIPAMIYKIMYRKPVVYDIFDFYADHLRATPEIIKLLIRKIDLYLISQANATILVDESRAKQIEGAKPRRLVYIYNAPEEIKISRYRDEKKAGLRIAYIGLLQIERGLLELIDVLKKRPEWHLDLAGFGGDEEKILARVAEMSNVTWHGRIPYDKTLAISAQADVLIATYNPSIPNHRYSSPNKLFEAMMLARPIVVAQETNMDRIVQEHRCGMIIPYGNIVALEEALLQLEIQPNLGQYLGENGRKAYETTYGWPIMRARIVQLYQSLA